MIGRSVARLQAMGPEARIRCQIGFSLRALSQCSTASGTNALDLATLPPVSSGPGPWVLLFRAPFAERRAQRLSGALGAGAVRRPPRGSGGLTPPTSGCPGASLRQRGCPVLRNRVIPTRFRMRLPTWSWKPTGRPIAVTPREHWGNSSSGLQAGPWHRTCPVTP